MSALMTFIKNLYASLHARMQYARACLCIVLITIKSRHHFVSLQRFVYILHIPMYTKTL